MFNTKQNNMNNIQFTPSAELKSINVQFSEKAQLGRPVDPNSARQKRLATAPGKKTGRPINPHSARQQRLCELDAKRIANGGTLKRGRPVNPNSARQIALQAAIAKAVAEQGWSDSRLTSEQDRGAIGSIASWYRFARATTAGRRWAVRGPLLLCVYKIRPRIVRLERIYAYLRYIHSTKNQKGRESKSSKKKIGRASYIWIFIIVF